MKRFDVLYVEAAGDLPAAFAAWRQGESYRSQTGLTFSGQFFDLCRSRGLSFCALSFSGKRQRIDDGPNRIETLPDADFGSGWRYHLGRAANGLTILGRALRYRPRYLVVSSGVTHWFLAGLARLAGIRAVAVLHSTLWPRGKRRRNLGSRLPSAADRIAFRHLIGAAACVSPECRRQIIELCGPRQQPAIFRFTPQFQGADFNPPNPAKSWWEKPFTIVYAGRIEANKGALQLVPMAARLKARGVSEFRFVVCGDGSALPELRYAIAHQGLDDHFRLLGRLDRPELLEAYKSGHLVIVPSRGDVPEGFAMVAAEAVLLGRPALCSDVVPAGEVLAEAVLTVPADDIGAFADAIGRLMTDQALYRKLCAGCRNLRPQFLDPERGFAHALDRAFTALSPRELSPPQPPALGRGSM